MTRKEASEKWQIIKAYGEGKTVQFWGASGEWFDIEEGFELPVEEMLRIKTEVVTMFEKEAEEWVKENMDCCKTDNSVNQSITYFDEEERCCAKSAFQDGAEFGYNKANEWHYMKDVNCYEDLPQNKDVYYAYVVNVGAYDKPTIERRLGCFAEFEYDVMAYHVIAWKEIVLPKELE